MYFSMAWFVMLYRAAHHCAKGIHTKHQQVNIFKNKHLFLDTCKSRCTDMIKMRHAGHAPSIGMALRRCESCCMAALISELVMIPRAVNAARRAASTLTLLKRNGGASLDSCTTLQSTYTG